MSVECIPMQVVDNRLVEYAKQRIPSAMAQSPQDALEAIRRGDKVFLRLYGSNVANVRSALREGGVEVSRVLRQHDRNDRVMADLAMAWGMKFDAAEDRAKRVLAIDRRWVSLADLRDGVMRGVEVQP